MKFLGKLVCCGVGDVVGPVEDEMYGADQLVDAARKGDLKGVMRQVDAGVVVSCRVRGGSVTALHAAASGGHVDVTQQLLDYGGNLHAKCKDGATPLTLACLSGHAEVVNLLLSRGANVKDRHSTGEPLLVLAYLADFQDVVRVLLEFEADVNEKTDIDCLLLAATHAGCKAYVEIFLQYGADVEVIDKEGWTALQIAVQKQRLDIVKLLEDYGATFPEEKTRIAKLDGYDVLSILGKGAFGKVFKVRDPATTTHYAIKQILCLDDEQLNNALAEVDMLQAASHPGVVQYHRSYTVECEGDQYFCVVMELCSFGTLQTYILSGKSRFDDATLLPIVQQLCGALSYLHGQGIFHRDLKPANIFFTKTGALKIGDFGLAKNFKLMGESTSGSIRQTQALGTPFYMSPEVFKGQVAQSGKVDIWGVGVTVLEVCGVPLKRPHEAVGNLGLEVTHNEEAEHARARLGLEIKGYSEFVCRLVVGMLSFNPDDRPCAAGVLESIEDRVPEDDLKEQRMRRACEVFVDAAENADVDIVYDYLAAGADPNLRCQRDGTSINALYSAARNGHEDVVDLLLQHEARVGDRVSYGGCDETPLVIAARLSQTEVVRTVLKHGVERRLDNSIVSSALLVSAEEGHIEIMRLLLTYGADVNHKAPYGTTALMMAAGEGHADACEVLLAQGASVDAKNQKGSTALMIAADVGHDEVVTVLIKAEAKIDDANNEGMTAIAIALKNNHFEITNQLSNKLYQYG